MWEPLLLFLTSKSFPSFFLSLVRLDLVETDESFVSSFVFAEFPVSWLLEKKKVPAPVEEEEEEEEGEDREQGETKIASALGVAPTSQAFAAFLDFLKNGCRGASQQGYPTLVVILSTIPVEVRPLFRRVQLTPSH